MAEDGIAEDGTAGKSIAKSGTSLERILASTQRLMLTKGFPATTIDEVCAAAGVTKGGFYYHFESKDQLALALVDHYFARIAAAFGAHRAPAQAEPLARALAFVDHAIAVARSPVLKEGCVLGALALELSATHPDVRAVIARCFTALAAPLESDLAAAIEEAHPRPDAEAGVLARQFLAVLEGSIVLSKAHDEPDLTIEALEQYGRSLRAIFQTPA